MKKENEPKKESVGLSEAEKAAAKARVKELRAQKSGKSDGEADVRAAIEAMGPHDREIAERLHALIKATAPLAPKTWYGMPAYANKDGKVLCFFRGSEKFKERYITFGFNQEALLDEGTMWPIAFAITELNEAEEQRVSALVAKAAGV